MQRKILSIIVFLIMLLFVLSQAVQAEEYKVFMKNWKYNPQELTVKVGDKVIWINDNDTRHTVTFYDQSITSSGYLKPEETYSLTFEKPGVFSYHCIPHGDYGMSGKVTVVAK
ncbi:MAG: cupredoxin domain-containing protein [Nitrospirae bacterium]|nr:cupredoxin domain-containing protein [Nitrospirota bacterium]